MDLQVYSLVSSFNLNKHSVTNNKNVSVKGLDLKIL